MIVTGTPLRNKRGAYSSSNRRKNALQMVAYELYWWPAACCIYCTEKNVSKFSLGILYYTAGCLLRHIRKSAETNPGRNDISYFVAYHHSINVLEAERAKLPVELTKVRYTWCILYRYYYCDLKISLSLSRPYFLSRLLEKNADQYMYQMSSLSLSV